MRRLLCALLLLFVTTAHAEDAHVGKLAPALDAPTWLTPTEATSLEEARGRVVVLLLGKAFDASIPSTIARWNDLRAAYLAKGLRVVGVVPAEIDTAPDGAEFSVVAAENAGYAIEDGEGVVLIGADGKVAWQGKPDEFPEPLVVKLLKKAKRFYLRRVDASVKAAATAFQKGQLHAARELAATLEHEDAKYVAGRVETTLTYWTQQVDRATAHGDPAETALYLQWIAKRMAGSPEATAATDKLKALKKDKQNNKAIKAAANYVRVRADMLKTKGKRKKIDALVKKAERLLGKEKDTAGGQRTQRLVTRVKTDPAIAALRAFIAKQKIKRTGDGWRTRLPKPPVVEFDDSRQYLWQLDTSEGQITLRLFTDVAPMHVTSIIYLTELGFFDELVFHRVIPGFMAQGGCPLGSGSGNPGYMFDGEYDPDTKHDRAGILSAANAGSPGTDGSQFFITFGPARDLDGKHTVYGETLKGHDTLKRLEAQGSPGGPTKKRLVIEKATIRVE
ncbi:MAG: peptidylprolyl isomerase [bacterium]|nr:peptidylprolyl isomerase [bacterium]